MNLVGPLFAVLSAAGYGSGHFLTQLGLRTGRINALQGMLINLIAANLALIVPVVVTLASGRLALNWLGFSYFFAAGLFAPLAGRGTNFLSIQRIGATRASTLASTESLFAAPIAYLALGQKISPTTLVGIVVLVAGVSLFVYEVTGARNGAPSIHIVAQEATSSRVATGVSLSLLSAFCFAAAGVFRQLGVDTMPSAVIGAFIGSFTALIIIVVNLAVTREMGGVRKAGRHEILTLAGSGVAATVGMLAFLWALQVGKTVAVSTALKNIAPLFAYLLGLIFLGRHERFTVRLAALVLVVVAGAVLVTVGRM